MPPDGLCANPECGAFFDEPPVRHRDKEEGQVVFLCLGCTRSVVAGNRYERLDPEGSSQRKE